MNIFQIAYWGGVILEVVIRSPYSKNTKSPKTDPRVSRTENILLGFMTLVGLVIPLIFCLTHWLDFANYTLPVWMGWLGILLEAGGLIVFARGHKDLAAYWSPSLEIRENHNLVTTGIYHFIRHPMYASQLLFVLAQMLLLQNWLAGPTGLLFFIPFYILRVRAEEKMMLDTFDDEYRVYMQNVGRILPKLSH